MDSGYSALSESGSTSHLPRNQKTKKHASVSIQTQTGESGGYTLPVKTSQCGMTAHVGYIPVPYTTHIDPYNNVQYTRERDCSADIVPCGARNEFKKMKTDDEGSRVLHVRGLPDDVSEHEIWKLVLPFKTLGLMVNFMHLKSKNQAFIEVDSIEMAREMVQYYVLNPPCIRQRTIHLQFSNHKQLSPPSSALQEKLLIELQKFQEVEGGNNHVLRVVVENMTYQITLDVLTHLFSQFGNVLKVITFTKNNQFQALIQMDCESNAQAAKLSLDGKNVYTNCCTLRIDYSKLQQLNVKFNNDKSRDYTRPELPQSDDYNNSHSHSHSHQHSQMIPTYQSGLMGQAPQMGIPTSMMSPLPTIQNGSSPYSPAPPSNGPTVLLVANLDEERITCDILFTLFGVYGNVLRVKILYNKKDNALLQMADNHQATTALTHLNSRVLHDKPLRVVFSKHQQVQLPKENHEACDLTKDFTNNPLHRFKKPGSKNFQNIHPPSETLHLSNIPPEIEEERIRELFVPFGNIKNFRFFHNDKKMALIEMGSEPEAVEALIQLHNVKLSDTNHLRVSFSRSAIAAPKTQ
ncbi:Oidioi.mRNA.OKI2018_I69.chr1.g3298.t1.cds [Oikopleura dioica]|uniref:Oidioi.mRNA.OKI2018_I69.chr1.g3298.t1.cds n=1 Tax=Oikopleura dioica TaxID=34765 RepID=A0ABN7STQ4_OIKDI|nr:Oidioi.mRNA.OKI2018_I69.chr1.g3298.t1.cds [Oikopleura dioica]